MNERVIKIIGYAKIITYMVDHCMDPLNDDDVKDALVEITMDKVHVTDADLDASLVDFREIQDFIRNAE